MRRSVLYLLAVLMLGACATRPRAPADVPAPPPLEPNAEPGPPAGAARETTAVAGLMESARADAAAGRLPNAAASLERALRIEPRNPRLWQELARVRLHQRDFTQAESMAQRSNSYAGSDSALRAENARIIEQARASR